MGGKGGAGAGGSSFGIYCAPGSTVMREGESMAVAGDAGVGGALGTTPGADGQSEDVVNCW